jgi:predicted DNA-binding WGR domain protein
MDSTFLYRIDATRNMSRFYLLDVQKDLFGRWCFVCEWGRLGRRGRMATRSYENREAAMAALTVRRRAKERRGYNNSAYDAVVIGV